jgi:hypothetical protein
MGLLEKPHEHRSISEIGKARLLLSEFQWN